MQCFFKILVRKGVGRSLIVQGECRKTARKDFTAGFLAALCLFSVYRLFSCPPFSRLLKTYLRAVLEAFIEALPPFAQGGETPFMAPEEADSAENLPPVDIELLLRDCQPEILATLAGLLEMAGISFEDYFEGLKSEKNWPFFGSLLGLLSLMVIERNEAGSAGNKKEAASDIQERYIPDLLKELRFLKSAMTKGEF